jgi:tetratricopeptide (TPR) repeat protein
MTHIEDNPNNGNNKVIQIDKAKEAVDNKKRAMFAEIIAKQKQRQEELNAQPISNFLKVAERSIDRGDFAEAKIYLEKVLKLNPKNIEALMKLGELSLHTKSFKEAEDYFSKVLDEDPERTIAWFNLGILYDEWDQKIKAIENYEQAIFCDPECSEAHYNLAVLLDQNGGNPFDAYNHYVKYLEYTDANDPFRGIAEENMAKLRKKMLVDKKPSSE